jgi:Tol biopolymer transport system component
VDRGGGIRRSRRSRILVTLASAGSEEKAIHFQVTPPPGAKFVLGAGGGSAISPDGRTIAFVAASGGAPMLWVRPLDSMAASELPGTDGAQYPFWSPDSRSIAFFAADKLKRIDLTGGFSAVITDAPSPRGGAWNQDGTIIFADIAAGQGLQRVPAAGGAAAPLLPVDATNGESSQIWPQFLPGGRRFLYFSVNRDPRRTGIFFTSLDHLSARTWLTEALGGGLYIVPRGQSGGYLLWSRQETLVARPFDPSAAQFTGEALRVPGGEAVSFLSGNRYSGVSASNGGDVLFVSGSERYRLSWFNREGRLMGDIGQPDRWASVRISPDATRVAVSAADSSGQRDISVIDFARSVQTRLTSGGGGLNAVWSPDGRRVIYYGVNRTSIFERSATGSGQQETIHESSNFVFGNDWSSDGRYLLYEELYSGRYNLWLLPLAPGNSGERKPTTYLKTSSSQSNGQFSPDGKWIVYTSDESGQQQIYVQGFPASEQKWQVSNAGGNFARWRRDGKELFYRAPDGKLMVASVRAAGPRLEFAVPAALFRITEPLGPHTYPYDVMPDGQRILALSKGTSMIRTSMIRTCQGRTHVS